MGDDAPPALSRTERRVAIGVLVLIVALAIQPAFVPRDPDRQTPFTWEMYAKGAPLEEYEIVTAGETRRVGVLGVQPRGHANVDYTRSIPPFVCETMPDVLEVRVFVARQLERVWKCEP